MRRRLASFFCAMFFNTFAAKVIHQIADIGISTCLHFGTNYWRTFDGLQYQFNGQCKYVMAQSKQRGWYVNIRMVNCHNFRSCRKVGEIILLPALLFILQYYLKCFIICIKRIFIYSAFFLNSAL